MNIILLTLRRKRSPEQTTNAEPDASGVLWVRDRQPRWTTALPTRSGPWWCRLKGNRRTADVIWVDVANLKGQDFSDVEWSTCPVVSPVERTEQTEIERARARLEQYGRTALVEDQTA